jgi:hypothetical protein
VFQGFARSNAEQEVVRRAAAEGIAALAPLIRGALGAWMEGSIPTCRKLAGLRRARRQAGARWRLATASACWC